MNENVGTMHTSLDAHCNHKHNALKHLQNMEFREDLYTHNNREMHVDSGF